MLLKQMKYFVSIVENNSFTEAAEKCFVSQSAISQQIKSLEMELGVELILRGNRSFTLTSAGEYFYRQSLIILDEIDRICNKTKLLSSNEENILKIGYLKEYGGYELQKAIANFTSKYKKIDLHIISGTHEELYEKLKTNSVDLVLNDQRRAFSEEYINYHLISSYSFIEISSRNPLATLNKIDISDIKNIPCILISSKEQLESDKEYYQRVMGFGGEFIFAKKLDEGRLFVAGNKGFMPVEDITFTTRKDIPIKRIALYRDEKQIKKDYFAFWKKSRTNVYIEEFAEILKKSFDDI